MGPLATVVLMKKVVSYTPATKDQDHIHVIADSFSQIPDRTTAILEKGVDPSPYMIQSAQRLEKAGADFLVIACNTAHFFFEAVKKSVRIPILHMPVETAKYLQENHFKKVGLLATDGTINTKLYQHSCQNFDIEVVEPDKVIQKEVMEGIYAIKGGKSAKGFLSLSTVANKLSEEGAEAIIAGCTEIPLVLKSSDEMVIIDPTEILAKTIIKTANEASNRIQLV
jgi:aspartate racemase